MITQEDIDGVVAVLKSGWLSLGPKITEFENNFAAKIGAKYAIGVNSGTSGLHLCIKALGIGKGDEVITSPFSFVASSNCALYEGAKPVFVDVKEETFNLDVNLIEAAITERTRAIVVPHIFGQSCDMTRLMEIARERNLYVIEDACESILAKHSGKNLGTFGDVSVFAFYPNKQMTTGEGGMILTDNKQIADLCRSLTNQGRSNNMQWLTHDKLGYNYRLDEMSASLGVTQFSRIDSTVSSRQTLAALYGHLLSGTHGLVLPSAMNRNELSWFVYPIRVPAQIRDQFLSFLHSRGVAAKAYFFPCIHMQPYFQRDFGYSLGDFPVAEKLSFETVVIPFYPQMQVDEVDQVVQAVKAALAELLPVRL
ncbi:DegT/DnrJ/EryC1/StrS family aminotransferase [archaeon]|nr:DegT/DnrJ/EryC1/StrS family aminotransferase [archaeon]MBT6697575.1 DegT/DnrJ/EryC1/StrS family aminotransferase [archaeon]